MVHLEQEISSLISQSILNLYQEKIEADQIKLQPTRKDFEGSFTYVTFPILKISRKSPEVTATEIGEQLVGLSDIISGFNVVKGFLNLVVSDKVWVEILADAQNDQNFGLTPMTGEKVMVEFSSPNTNKPLHLGHLRNNFLGDSVARILAAAGYEVMKTNLVNDRGIHICKSMLAYEKFGNGETPASSGIKGDHLVGRYYVKFDQEYKKEIEQLVASGASEEEAKRKAPLIQQAQEYLKLWEQKDPKVVDLWSKLNGWVYDGFNETYKTMGIDFDKIYHESETYLLGKDIIEEGLEKKVFFRKEDGSVWVDLTPDGLDEKLVLRSDGTSVYMTQDIGTCDFKYRDFPMQKSVYVVGNEQDYHFKVLFKIMQKLGRSYGEGLYHLSYGMVDLPSGKMKSREGTVVDADDLMLEMFQTAEKQTKELGKIESLSDMEAAELYKTLGLGALKYFLLKVDPKKRMLFNPEESIEFQGHTGPFIQYTHARISAILRRAKDLDQNGSIDSVSELNSYEQSIIAHIYQFPQTVRSAASEYSPALIAQYVYDLAKLYNSFYQEVSIFNESNDNLKNFRIALSESTARIIKRAMGLLGVNVPERM